MNKIAKTFSSVLLAGTTAIGMLGCEVKTNNTEPPIVADAFPANTPWEGNQAPFDRFVAIKNEFQAFENNLFTNLEKPSAGEADIQEVKDAAQNFRRAIQNSRPQFPDPGLYLGAEEFINQSLIENNESSCYFNGSVSYHAGQKNENSLLVKYYFPNDHSYSTRQNIISKRLETMTQGVNKIEAKSSASLKYQGPASQEILKSWYNFFKNKNAKDEIKQLFDSEYNAINQVVEYADKVNKDGMTIERHRHTYVNETVWKYHYGYNYGYGFGKSGKYEYHYGPVSEERTLLKD